MYDVKDMPTDGGLTEEQLREIIAKQLRTGQAVYGQPATQQQQSRPQANIPQMKRLAMLRERLRNPEGLPGTEDDLRKQAIMSSMQGGSM